MYGHTAIIKEPLPNPKSLPTVYTQVIELPKNLEKPHPVRSGHPSP